jgi:hypothetical protein
MIFYVFFETEDDFGRFRQSFGFTTEAARHAWISEELRLLRLTPSADLSDLEEWESDDPTWSHIRILA